jgi:CCDC93, coiled-coil domain
MSNKQKFSKIIPNIKLSTRLDADGNEIDVEIREDTEASQCRKKILDLLLSAGYFRVMIKNLSDFDKIVGGMTWCIEACEFDVDVDILFHENLTIGQKISLTERVVTVLPLMKCPFVLEPHQIQGLDFINIFPVIQWLVNTSVKLRSEKAERLKMFAVGQFHNHFAMTNSEKESAERIKIIETVKKVEDLYALKRQYKRKQNLEPQDEYSRCRLTLMEYGVRSVAKSLAKHEDDKSQNITKDNFTDKMEQDEVCGIFSMFHS